MWPRQAEALRPLNSNLPVTLLVRLVCAEYDKLVVLGDGVLGPVQQGVVLQVHPDYAGKTIIYRLIFRGISPFPLFLELERGRVITSVSDPHQFFADPDPDPGSGFMP